EERESVRTMPITTIDLSADEPICPDWPHALSPLGLSITPISTPTGSAALWTASAQEFTLPVCEFGNGPWFSTEPISLSRAFGEPETLVVGETGSVGVLTEPLPETQTETEETIHEVSPVASLDIDAGPATETAHGPAPAIPLTLTVPESSFDPVQIDPEFL